VPLSSQPPPERSVVSVPLNHCHLFRSGSGNVSSSCNNIPPGHSVTEKKKTAGGKCFGWTFQCLDVNRGCRKVAVPVVVIEKAAIRACAVALIDCGEHAERVFARNRLQVTTQVVTNIINMLPAIFLIARGASTADSVRPV